MLSFMLQGRRILYKDEARKVPHRIVEGSLDANVDAELLQEIPHVYAARKERAKGFDTIDDLLVLSRTLFR